MKILYLLLQRYVSLDELFKHILISNVCRCKVFNRLLQLRVLAHSSIIPNFGCQGPIHFLPDQVLLNKLIKEVVEGFFCARLASQVPYTSLYPPVARISVLTAHSSCAGVNDAFPATANPWQLDLFKHDCIWEICCY